MKRNERWSVDHRSSFVPVFNAHRKCPDTPTLNTKVDVSGFSLLTVDKPGFICSNN